MCMDPAVRIEGSPNGGGSATGRRVEINGIRVDRLSMLLDFFREEAVGVCSRARLEDDLTPAELSTALGFVSRIEGLADRLVDHLTKCSRRV